GLGRGELPGEERQPHQEEAASTEPVAHRLHAPARDLDEPAHQREPDAEAALRSLSAALALDEEIEDLRQQLGRDPDAVVLHPQSACSPSRSTTTRMRPPGGV